MSRLFSSYIDYIKKNVYLVSIYALYATRPCLRHVFFNFVIYDHLCKTTHRNESYVITSDY